MALTLLRITAVVEAEEPQERPLKSSRAVSLRYSPFGCVELYRSARVGVPRRRSSPSVMMGLIPVESPAAVPPPPPPVEPSGGSARGITSPAVMAATAMPMAIRLPERFERTSIIAIQAAAVSTKKKPFSSSERTKLGTSSSTSSGTPVTAGMRRVNAIQSITTAMTATPMHSRYRMPSSAFAGIACIEMDAAPAAWSAPNRPKVSGVGITASSDWPGANISVMTTKAVTADATLGQILRLANERTVAPAVNTSRATVMMTNHHTTSEMIELSPAAAAPIPSSMRALSSQLDAMLAFGCTSARTAALVADTRAACLKHDGVPRGGVVVI